METNVMHVGNLFRLFGPQLTVIVAESIIMSYNSIRLM